MALRGVAAWRCCLKTRYPICESGHVVWGRRGSAISTLGRDDGRQGTGEAQETTVFVGRLDVDAPEPTPFSEHANSHRRGSLSPSALRECRAHCVHRYAPRRRPEQKIKQRNASEGGQGKSFRVHTRLGNPAGYAAMGSTTQNDG